MEPARAVIITPRIASRTASMSRSRNTPFHGLSFRGGPVATIVSGRIVWQLNQRVAGNATV